MYRYRHHDQLPVSGRFVTHPHAHDCANSESLAFTVPWPFLVDGIESTIEMETKKKRNSKWLHLVMKKSLNDAWPAGFGGRSKWDTDLLIKPWRDFPSNGTLKMHIEAQFDCVQLLSNHPQNRTVLDQVRGLMRTLFYSHCNDIESFNLFAIYDNSQLDVPVFHLRIHPSGPLHPSRLPFTSCLCHQSSTRSSVY